MSLEKITLRIEPLGKEFRVKKNTHLKDIVNELGVEFPCGGEGYCGGCKIKLLSGDVKNPEYHKELNYKLGIEGNYRLACISEVCEDIVLEIPQLETIVLADNSTYSFTSRDGFGIAVDLGTTTIVAQMIDMQTGQVVGVQTARNSQSIMGSDIMSRVLAGMTVEGKEKSKNLIRAQIFSMIIELLENKDVNLSKIVIVGNTVMHHLFCGIDVTPLSHYPFEIIDNSTRLFSPKELCWDLDEYIKVIFVRPIAGFIGSDILAGIFASKISNQNELIALIDLGTNGEIVVGNKNKIVCASTAAGPAFEGANIHMGMSAITGAISSVEILENKISCHVIGNQQARGICGSGLIDSIKIFLDNKSVDFGGAILNNIDKLMISESVYITQKDIREFQLGKAALASGLQILNTKLGKELSDITQVFIAGGFGNFLNLENVTQTGMIEVSESKIKKLGNTSLIGAKMFLFFDDYDFVEILKKIEHISLDSDKDFQEIFIDKMFFSNLK